MEKWYQKGKSILITTNLSFRIGCLKSVKEFSNEEPQMKDELSTIKKSLFSKVSSTVRHVVRNSALILKRVSTIYDVILATLYTKEKTILNNKLSLYFRKYLYLKM